MMRYLSCLLAILIAFSCHSQNKQALEAVDFSDKIKSTPNSTILDVRTPGEFSEGFIEKAVNMDYNDAHFEDKVKLLDHAKTYFVYCLSGGRSVSAADLMRQQGFKNVYELKGGMMAWRKNNLPVAVKQVVAADKISQADYEALTNQSAVVLIDFYAPWCGPCKKIQPILEELEKEYAGKAFITRINIDENKQLTRRLGIDEIPFFKLYRNGIEKGNYVGQMDKKSLKRVLDGE